MYRNYRFSTDIPNGVEKKKPSALKRKSQSHSPSRTRVAPPTGKPAYPELLKKILLKPRSISAQPARLDINQNAAESVVWKYSETLDDTVPTKCYVDLPKEPDLLDAGPSKSKTRQPGILKTNFAENYNCPRTKVTSSHAVKQTTFIGEKQEKAKFLNEEGKSDTNQNLLINATPIKVSPHRPIVSLKVKRMGSGEWILHKTVGQDLVTEATGGVPNTFNCEIDIGSTNISRIVSQEYMPKPVEKNYEQERLIRINKRLSKGNEKVDALNKIQPSDHTHPLCREEDSNSQFKSGSQQQKTTKEKVKKKKVQPEPLSYDDMSLIDKLLTIVNALASDGNNTNDSSASYSGAATDDIDDEEKDTMTISAITNWLSSLIGDFVTKFFTKEDNKGDGDTQTEDEGDKSKEDKTTNDAPPKPNPPLSEQVAQFEESLFNNQSIALLERIHSHKAVLLSQYQQLLEQVKSTSNLMDKVSNTLILSTKSSTATMNIANTDDHEEEEEEHDEANEVNQEVPLLTSTATTMSEVKFIWPVE